MRIPKCTSTFPKFVYIRNEYLKLISINVGIPIRLSIEGNKCGEGVGWKVVHIDIICR